MIGISASWYSGAANAKPKSPISLCYGKKAVPLAPAEMRYVDFGDWIVCQQNQFGTFRQFV
jgi:hypothetical protein